VTNTKARRARTRAAAFAGILLVLSVTAACGGAGGSRIDPARLADELGRVVFQVKNAQGFDYHVGVRCSSDGGDGLRFTCHVEATTPGRPLNAWDETVTCRPPQHADIPRCATASGYSLQ
jgi:hypothetical protein